MLAVVRPQLELRPAGERGQPGGPDRGDGGIDGPGCICVAPRQARLHLRERVAREVPAVARSVAPCLKEQRSRAGGGDLLREHPHVRVEFAGAVVGRKRRDLALLLQHDDVPTDVAQQPVEFAIRRKVPQLPAAAVRACRSWRARARRRQPGRTGSGPVPP